MSRERYHANAANGTLLGVDVGATLAKLVVCRPGAPAVYPASPSGELTELAESIHAEAPERVGLSGGGAVPLPRQLRCESTLVGECEAWGVGLTTLLEDSGQRPAGKFLAVSPGTGTSIMLVDGARVSRVGGTALGGGTLLGLGTLIAGHLDFPGLCRLAENGSRKEVDLFVSDVYAEGTPPLPWEFTAAAFGRLARTGVGAAHEPADLAHALMNLIGENVAQICGGLALLTGVERIVFGGSTLRANPILVRILAATLRAYERQAEFPADAEFAAALGALLVSRE